MSVYICPNCNRRFIAEGDTTDFEHTCNSGNEALDNEDVLVVGDWNDYTGSGIRKNVLLQGSTNKLWGTRAQTVGEDLEDLTSRGKSTDRYRTRQHLEWIDLSKKKE